MGRLVAVQYHGGSRSDGTYYGYDQVGQVVQKIQSTDNVAHSMSASYDLAGGMLTETYPTGRMVNYGYDGSCRLSGLSSPALSGTTGGVSLGGISYAASGTLLGETYGNNLVHTIAYNSRLQPISIGLASVSTGAFALQLNYAYTSTSTSNDNNGNVLQITSAIGTNTFIQSFTYPMFDKFSVENLVSY